MRFKIFGREISISKKDQIEPYENDFPESEDVFLAQVMDDIKEMRDDNEKSLWLSMDDYGVSKIPDIVWEVDELKELFINCGPKLELSSEIKKLKKLESISFQCYPEDSESEYCVEIIIPEDIKHLKKLKSLEFHGEGISDIPNNFELCPNIESVEFWYTKIKKIPDFIFKLKKLKQFEIIESSLNTLSPKICDLVQLRTLVLSGLGISKLPLEIGSLLNLTVLNLEENKLTSLPKSFENLRKLESVNLSQNKFDEFPERSLFSQRLRSLDIQGNPFTITPEVLDMGIHELKRHFKLSTNFRLSIPKSLITAFQQYLLFFREYVLIAKGIEVQFDVFVSKNFLEISIDFDQYLDEHRFVEYFDEYLNLARENTIRVLNVEGDPNPNQIDLLRLNLELQISNLTNQLKMKDWQIEFLKTELAENKLEKKEILNLISKQIFRKVKSNDVSHCNKNVYSECNYLLRKGEIGTIFDRLLELDLRGHSQYDNLILLSNRWKNCETRNDRGTIDSKEFNMVRNKISSTLLTIIRKLEKEKDYT